MFELKVNGIGLLNNGEKQRANELLEEYTPKIERMLKNDVVLEVYFKEHEKEGNRKKYSIDAKVILTKGIIFSASAFDWDFSRTFHKVMTKLQTEIEHKFHSSDKYDKGVNGKNGKNGR